LVIYSGRLFKAGVAAIRTLNPPEVWIAGRTIPMITAVKNSQIRGTRFKIQFISVHPIHPMEISKIAGTDRKRLPHRSTLQNGIVFVFIGKQSIHLNRRCGGS